MEIDFFLGGGGWYRKYTPKTYFKRERLWSVHPTFKIRYNKLEQNSRLQENKLDWTGLDWTGFFPCKWSNVFFFSDLTCWEKIFGAQAAAGAAGGTKIWWAQNSPKRPPPSGGEIHTNASKTEILTKKTHTKKVKEIREISRLSWIHTHAHTYIAWSRRNKLVWNGPIIRCNVCSLGDVVHRNPVIVAKNQFANFFLKLNLYR